MSVVFWILAGVLVAVALGLLLWPLLARGGGAAAASRKALNTAVYRDQVAELERDRASGALTEADYSQAREELQRRLLEDVITAEPAPAAVGMSARGKWTALALLIVVPLLATLLYGWRGNPAGIAAGGGQGQQTAVAAHPAVEGDGGGGPNAGDLDKMASVLAARLEKNPNNPEEWALLGRTYKALGRYDDAEKAFKRAGPIMDQDPVLILENAELVAIRAGGRLEGKPLDLINKVLKMQPDNPQALLLAGSAAYFRRDFAAAVDYWQRMLKQVPPGSEDARALIASIDKAKSQMGAAGGSKGAASQLAPVLADSGAASAAPTPQAAAPGGGSVSGRLDLAPALKAKAAPNDTVFIFARAVQGPRMPLAVQRVRVADLPLNFTLDDSMAMSPAMKMSSFPEIRIEARVSKSGNAMPQTGDLSGSAGPIKVGAKGVKLTIDQVVP